MPIFQNITANSLGAAILGKSKVFDGPSPAQFSSDFHLLDLSIRTHTGEEKSLMYVSVQFSIFESVFSPFLSGEIIIQESLNLPAYFPIVGHETIIIRWATPDRKEAKIEGKVYKLGPRQLVNPRTQQYTLFFVSNEALTNEKTKVSKAFKEKYPQELIEEIYSFLKSSKSLSVENGLEPISVVFPSITPLDCIKWVCSRSLAETKPLVSSFIFFERINDGFFFTPIEYLFEQEPYTQFFYQPASIRESADNPTRTIEKDFRSITRYSLVKTFDNLSLIRSGSFASKMIKVDIYHQEFHQKDLGLVEAWEDHVHIEPDKGVGQGLPAVCSIETDGLVKAFDSKKDLVIKTNFDFDQEEQFEWPKAATLQRRAMTFGQLEAISLRVTVPGDSEIRSGQIVDVVLPSIEPQDEEFVLDKYYSGRYLVGSVNHTIDGEKYVMTLDLLKDSTHIPMPLPAQNTNESVDILTGREGAVEVVTNVFNKIGSFFKR